MTANHLGLNLVGLLWREWV